MPYDRSLRPETTYLIFNQVNNYGPIDIRVAFNNTGNEPVEVRSNPGSSFHTSMMQAKHIVVKEMSCKLPPGLKASPYPNLSGPLRSSCQ